MKMMQHMMEQELPALPYDFAALEPVISGEIMELHYTKHHAGYVNNFNNFAQQAHEAMEREDLPALIALQPKLRFNGGGHINHSLFWTNLAPIQEGGGTPPSAPLSQAIDQQWGSLEKFIETFNSTTAAIPGSGWGWLGYCSMEKRLYIETCANQDPLSTKELIPLLGIDVWEHAYYLQYKNARPAYLKEIWKVINWKRVCERYEAALKKANA